MDFKSLISKIDHLDKKQILTESVETVQRTVEQSIEQIPAEEISIYEALLAEFSYGDIVVDEAEDFKFSPEQEKWLGGANRQDPYIIARMPGAKPPLTYFKDPEDQAIAKRLNIGQSNLNAVKSLVGMKPGDAQTFADPTTAKPAAGQAAQPAPSPAGPQNDAQHQADGNSPAPAAQTFPVKEPGKVTSTELPPAAQTFPVREPGKITSTEQPPGGQAAQPAKDAEGQGTIDPNKLKRFKELLAKAGAK